MRTNRFIFIMIAFLISCTEKGTPIVQHEPDRRSEDTDSVTTVAQSADKRIADEDVLVLSKRVLDRERIRDLSSYSSRGVLDDLLELNLRLIRSDVSDRSAKILPILKDYAAALELECGDIKSSCLGLKYFRRAASSAEVVKMMAQMPEFKSQSSRLLLFAIELKNGLADLKLFQLLLADLPPSDATSRSLLETSLMRASQDINQPTKLREFLMATHAWEMIENKKWNLSGAAQSTLWSMIARARLFDDGSGQPSQTFLDLNADLMARPDSLASRQKALLAKGKIKPQALGANLITQFDELTYLLDAVFLQILAPQTAAEIFQNSGRSAQSLFDAVDNYVRLRFVIGLEESTQLAKGIFKASVPTEQLLIHAMKESSLVKQVWGSLKGRQESVKNFALSALKLTNAGTSLEPKARALFNSYGRSVNQASTYPHELLLFQMLSQKRFKITLRGLGELDTGDLMSMLFYGTLPPLLDYSDEITPLNHFEIIYAFDMAVRSGLLPSMDINVDDFMSDILSRLMQAPITSVTEVLDRVERRFGGETSRFRDFKNICQEFHGADPVPRVIDLPGIRLSPYFGDVMEFLYTDVSSKGGTSSGESGGIMRGNLGLFYMDAEYGEALERVRLNLGMYERIGQAMLASYGDYLKRFEYASDDRVEKLTSKTRAQLEVLTKVRERTLKTASKWWNEVGWCYFKAGQRDIEFFHMILNQEEEYLRGVHRDMRRLRAAGISAQESQRIKESRYFKGLPGGFRGLDRLDKDAYTVTSIDFMIRSANYLQKVAPHVTVNFGSQLNMDVVLVRDATIRQLLWTESEDDFVNSGLKAYFSKKEPFVTWITLAGARVLGWANFLKSMMSIYRLENEVLGAPQTFSAEKILSAHEDILKLTQLSPEDRKLMSVIHESMRFDPLYLNDRLITYTVDLERGKFAFQDIWGLFDLPVLLASYEKLGYDYDQSHMGPEQPPASRRPKRFGFMELGRLYYNARSNWMRGNPIIPYNAVLDKELGARVSNVVQKETAVIQSFHQATESYVNSSQRRSPSLRPRADIDISQSVTQPLSETLIPNFNDELRRFRQNTQDCFSSRCADFN